MVFNLQCRTCLIQESQTIPLTNSVFIKEYNIEIGLIDVIKECASVEICLDNTKPHNICTTCVQNAIISYTFRRKCKQSQLALALGNNAIKLEGDIITNKVDTDLLNIKTNKYSVCGENNSDSIKVEQLSKSCDVCGKSYVSCESLYKHKRLKHAQNQTVAEDCAISHCDFCAWTGTSADLGKHKVAKHAHMKSIECAECKKTFFTNHSLRLHMLVHTGEKKHMCEVCGVSFALQSNLIIHKRVHTGEKPYKCNQCDKTFTQHSSLHVHKFTHTDKPTFRCGQCAATFYRKDSFQYHVKKHRSVDEWDKCEICDRRFKSRKLLKNHMIVHTGERNHQCTSCGKSFGRRSSLRTHMNIHTGDKRHVCLVCGRGFLQKHVLGTHMKIHAKK